MGRSEELVGPLIEQFEAESGLDVQVEYAGTTDLAATILEEGENSPADVFFAQDAGALGAVAAAGQLATLPGETLALVPDRFASDDGQWVGVSGRARVVIYDTRVLAEADLPSSIDGFTDPAWKGRIGWAPTNASLQSFVTAYRVLHGDAAATAWLEGIQANEPKVYDGNDAVLAAVAAGEIEVGFVNHYYLMRQLIEQGDDFPVRNHFLAGGDTGSLVNVAGAGILSSAKNPDAAQRFVDFLLSPASQTYFATETSEYPLVDGVAADPKLPALTELESPDIDLSDLADLQGTLRLMQEAGVL
ncbi:MAG TPA: iron ABC transporter substrate-binding protein [Candidatus Saccharimonadales bacterium]|nr:iron ABC transporter substrate-binding protein [Candidatus Saccharimonadales bacterium]